jgi:hypothetical protein
VKAFTEKPDHDTAVRFIESGDFFGTPASSSGAWPASANPSTNTCLKWKRVQAGEEAFGTAAEAVSSPLCTIDART